MSFKFLEFPNKNLFCLHLILKHLHISYLRLFSNILPSQLTGFWLGRHLQYWFWTHWFSKIKVYPRFVFKMSAYDLGLENAALWLGTRCTCFNDVIISRVQAKSKTNFSGKEFWPKTSSHYFAKWYQLCKNIIQVLRVIGNHFFKDINVQPIRNRGE